MPDPVTNNYSIALPTVGGDVGTWGTVQNNGIFTPLDAILGSNFTTTITSADVTLTTSQFQNAIFIVSGTLTGNHSLIVPLSANSATAACGGRFVVVNNGSGSFNLTVKTAASGSQGVTVPQGFAALLYSDTVNIGYAVNGLPGFAQASNGNPNNVLTGTAASTTTNASLAWDYVNSILYVCTGGSTWAAPVVSVTRGFDMPVNLAFTTAVSGNLLTVTAVAANTNTTPTATNPIVFPFRDATLTGGDVVTVNATGALSINTFSTGATLGSLNNGPFRFWIVAFNNSGAVVLGLVNCSATSGYFTPNETGLGSSSSIGSTATATATYYTPNGVTVSNAAFRIVGFVEYGTGLVTAGTYNNPPTKVQLFGPGIKKPGDVVQTVYNSTTSASSVSSTVKAATNLSTSITPTSAVNLVRAACHGQLHSASANGSIGVAQLFRSNGSVPIGNFSAAFGTGGSNAIGAVACYALDQPLSTSATQYNLYIKLNSGTDTYTFLDAGTSLGTNPGNLQLDEIMG